jgi:hypothetical protein
MKSSVIAALLATTVSAAGQVGEACDTTANPDNGACDAALRCATAPVANLNTCVAVADCDTDKGNGMITCYESPTTTPYVPCSDENTKKNNIILNAMNAAHATVLAKKTADVTTYETDLKALTDDVAAKQIVVDTAIKDGTTRAH